MIYESNYGILCGEHEFQGVEMGDGFVRFRLDGTNYEVYEDPSDGYRSYCQDVETTDNNPEYIFPVGIDIVVHRIRNINQDMIAFVDVENGEEILRFGTDHCNDYYPVCVFEYHPENAACNKREGE